MPSAKCEHPKCRSRNPRAVWLIDGKKYCGFCGEREIELHGIDQIRICRLSDNMFDFAEPDFKYQNRTARA